MNFINLVLNFIFPQTCGICEKICDDVICNRCKKQLEKITFSTRKCFLDLNGIYYDEHMYLFKYNGIIREKIKLYKFGEQGYLCDFFAKIIFLDKKTMNYIEKYDYITPIPLHKHRKRERGYNQSELILNSLNKLDKNIKIEKDILFKIKNIKPQSSLNELERKENIRNAFIVNNIEKIRNKKILIFDDVYTTGSTTNECARILKEKGAIKVGVLTIAKD